MPWEPWEHDESFTQASNGEVLAAGAGALVICGIFYTIIWCLWHLIN